MMGDAVARRPWQRCGAQQVHRVTLARQRGGEADGAAGAAAERAVTDNREPQAMTLRPVFICWIMLDDHRYRMTGARPAERE
jgi:hypothetical protein